MADIAELKKRLIEIKDIENNLDRRMLVLAVITEAIKEVGITPILVGDAAVEFYTFGGYATGDIDVIMPVSSRVDEIMSLLGFDKEGRFWVYKEADIYLESPPPPLAGEYDRVIEIDVGGAPVSVIGIEDLIIDRLNAYVHWKSKEDGRWVRRLISIHKSEIDFDYLKKRASAEGVQEALSENFSEDK